MVTRHMLAVENGIVVWWWKLPLRGRCDGEDVTVTLTLTLTVTLTVTAVVVVVVVVSGCVVPERLFKDVFRRVHIIRVAPLCCVFQLRSRRRHVGVGGEGLVDVGNWQLVVRYVCACPNAYCAVMYIQRVLPIADTLGVECLDGGWRVEVSPRM